MDLKLLNKDWSKPTIKSIIIRALSYSSIMMYLLNLLYLFLNKSEVGLFDELSDSFVAPIGDAYQINKN
jgi:hypothetical protein